MKQPTKITYSQLFSFGEYQNETIGVELPVEAGDDPHNLLLQAAGWAEAQHNALQKARGAREVYYDLERRKIELEQALARIKAEGDTYRRKAIQAIAFLIHAGLHPVKVPPWIADSEIREELQQILEQRGYFRDVADRKGLTVEDLAEREREERGPF